MEWVKSESSNYQELQHNGSLVAAIDETVVRGVSGWIVWNNAGQQVALRPTLQTAMQAARELCTSTAQA